MSAKRWPRRPRRSTHKSRWDEYNVLPDTDSDDVPPRETASSSGWTPSQWTSEDASDHSEGGVRPRGRRNSKGVRPPSTLDDRESDSSSLSFSRTPPRGGRRGVLRIPQGSSNSKRWERRSAASRDDLGVAPKERSVPAAEGAIKSDTSKHRDTTPKSGERGATTVQEAAAPIHDSYVNGDTKNSSVLSTSTGKSAQASAGNADQFLSPRIPRRTRQASVSKLDSDDAPSLLSWNKEALPSASDRSLRAMRSQENVRPVAPGAEQESAVETGSEYDEHSDANGVVRQKAGRMNMRFRRKRRRLTPRVFIEDSGSGSDQEKVLLNTPLSSNNETDADDGGLLNDKRLSSHDVEDPLSETEPNKKRPSGRDSLKVPKKRGKLSRSLNPPSVTPEAPYILSNAQDTSFHKKDCYVCGTLTVTPAAKPIKGQSGVLSIPRRSVSTAPMTSAPSAALYCRSCLRSYHSNCLEAIGVRVRNVRSDAETSVWCCPKCLNRFVPRRVPFYRNGKRTPVFSADDDPELYFKMTVGLTGRHATGGCGDCGVASSQRRVAVICDNCDREWHLQCLGLQDLPWGNWFCPDCVDLHVCALCVLSGVPRSFESGECSERYEAPKDLKTTKIVTSGRGGSNGTEKDILCSEEGASSGAESYYHVGRLVLCQVCYLRYHPSCVRHAIGLHRLETVHEPPVSRQSKKEDEEFWCCPQCQEHLGIHRIVSQRRWPSMATRGGAVDGEAKTYSSSDQRESVDEIQLLVKMKTQSYRRLMWLPLERVKAIYPIGVRKWLGTWAAMRLLDTVAANGANDTSEFSDATRLENDQELYEDDDDDDEDANVEDVAAIFNSSDSEEFYSINGDTVMASTAFPGLPHSTPYTKQPTDKLAKELSSQQDAESTAGNSSSVRKLKFDASRSVSVMGMKRPPEVKKEWLIPSRVIGQRICLRGTLRVEFYVKWTALGYEESTWELFPVVKNTRALRMFRAAVALEEVIAARPAAVERCVDDDPTVPEPLLPPGVAHPPPPENAVLVPGRQYLIQTSAVHGASGSLGDTSKSTNSFSSVQSSISSTIFPPLEKRKKDMKAGLFVPYVDRPSFLSGHYLFDYQLDGINWLRFAWSKKRSVILADEMGLGKTVQVVAFLGSLWNDLAVQGPFLVIAPLATLEDVWVRELAHWIPFANVVSYFGNPEARQICRDTEFFIHSGGSGAREWLESSCFKAESEPEYDRSDLRPRLPKMADRDRFAKFDVIVTSYEIFRKDHWLFRQLQWKVIVVDEGHRLKSFGSEIKRALEACQSSLRLLLTGTPLQNSIDELFSLLNVLHPEQFPESCKDEFQDVVTQEATIERLKRELQPHILRRTKRDVMGGRMPAKKERLVRIENSPTQREMYRNIILRNHMLLSSKDTGGAGVLCSGSKRNVRVTSLRNIVMQMRKCCNHPYLFDDGLPVIRTEREFTDLVEASGKLKLLDRMLKLLISNGHRVLIFSQFMRMLNILEEYLNYRQYGFERLDGSTSAGERQRAIDRFNTQTNKKFVFLLSTRAGGLGINLTSADTVIIFDSDWNPHNDLQAQARAHRLGQTKKVAIYRFMTRATVEERIIEIARNKLVLDQVVAGRISLRDVEAVVRCGARELFDQGQASKQVHYDDAQLEKLLSRDSDDEENDDLEERDEGAGFREGVLSSFKVARFEDLTTETPQQQEDAVEEEDDGFWANLLENQASVLPCSEDGVLAGDNAVTSGQFPTGGLGRGMRARREVAHFGHTILRDGGLPGDDTDDANDEDDDEDEEEDSEPDDVKNRSNREGRGNGGPGSQKPGGSGVPQVNKRLRKDKKKVLDFFDLYVLIRFTWENGEPKDIQFIEGAAKGNVFRSKYPFLIPDFVNQVRCVRRSLGLSEGAKAARQLLHSDYPHSTPTAGENVENTGIGVATEKDDLAVFSPRLGVEKEPLHAFQLDWDEQWCKRVISVQLCPKIVQNQTFIVQRLERQFLLCAPVPLLSVENDPGLPTSASPSFPLASGTQFAAAMRELKTEEFVRWRGQLTATCLRSGNVSSAAALCPLDVSKTSTRTVLATALSTACSTFRPTYPDFVSLRKTLDSFHHTTRNGGENNAEASLPTYDDYLQGAFAAD